MFLFKIKNLNLKTKYNKKLKKNYFLSKFKKKENLKINKKND
jgi:hypothetical protein